MELSVKNIEEQTILSKWKFPPEIVNYVNNSIIKTVIRIYHHPKNVLIRKVDVVNPYSTTQKITNLNMDNTMKICLNITINNATNHYNPIRNLNTCIQYERSDDEWTVPLGSSLAAFLILTLVVLLVFFVKRFGSKHQKIMHRKSSRKRKPRNSYMFIYPIPEPCDKQGADCISNNTGNAERKLSDSNNTGEYELMATATISSQGNNDELEYLTDDENDDTLPPHADDDDDDDDDDEDNEENDEDFDEIIKCNCGLIHLVGTELECDSFIMHQQDDSNEVDTTNNDNDSGDNTKFPT